MKIVKDEGKIGDPLKKNFFLGFSANFAFILRY